MTNPPAKKSLGQNWLVNTGVAERIVQAAGLDDSSTVLEIGPGTGVLTTLLSESAGRVIAVEKDARLIGELRTRFTDNPRIRIEEGDALELDPTALGLESGGYTVVANLPYYITSHFIRMLLSAWPRPSSAVLMVQSEVAERMTAAAPDMNLLALSVSLYSAVERVMRVSRGSFRPVPSVDSAVVKLTPFVLEDTERTSRERALDVARRAFGQKRKMLTATLEESALLACGIEPSSRPQELPSDAWLCLAQRPSG